MSPYGPHGVVHPHTDDSPPEGLISPFVISIREFCDLFGTSQVRKKLLRGFLTHRAELRELGLQGWHYVGGSFVEDKERLQGKPPRDIDVVTFIEPAQQLSEEEQEALTAKLKPLVATARERLGCHSNTAPANDDQTPEAIEFWLGLFGHQRVTLRWKGIYRIPLDECVDDAACMLDLERAAR